MRSQQDYVLRTVEERGIRFVQLWFTDVLGTPKSFHITPAELENALDEGMTFDGSAIDGFSRVQESDVLARPDAKTFQLLPWHWHGRAPRWPGWSATSSTWTAPRSRADPRHVLRRTLERARGAASPSSSPPSSSTSTSPTPTRRRRRRCRSTGLLLRPDHQRPGQRPPARDGADPRGDGHPGRARPARGRPQPARDRPALHRRPDHGRHGHDGPDGGQGDRPRSRACTPASCPSRWPGSRARACTPTCRSSRASTNAFVDADDPYGLSEVAEQFIAGLLRHAREITAVTNQWVNSYKRLIVGYEAPVHIVVGPQQPLGPGPGPARSSRARRESTRIEYRAPDTRLQPLPGLRRRSWPPGWRVSRRATSCRRRPTPTSSSSRPERAARPRGSSRLPGSPERRGRRRWSTPS